MAEANASGDVCPSGQYMAIHQDWWEVGHDLMKECKELASLPPEQLTFMTVKQREPDFPPRLWSTVVSEERVPYNWG